MRSLGQDSPAPNAEWGKDAAARALEDGTDLSPRPEALCSRCRTPLDEDEIRDGDGFCILCSSREVILVLSPELDDETVAVLRAVATGKAPAALLEFLRAHLECESAQLNEEKLVAEEAPEARCLEAEVRVDAAIDREIKATSALQATLVESLESLGNSGGASCPS